MDEKNPMQQVVGFMPEMQDITRQREMAKLLMQQGQAPLQGQMVGNKYVAASPWEGIANLFSTYKANKLAKEADTKQAQLAELIRKGTAEDMLRYNELMYGAPERTVYGAGQEGPTMNLAPATEANPRAAYEFALQSRFPQVNAYATEMQKPQKLGADETLQRFNPVTGKMEVVGQGTQKAPEKIQTAAIVLGLDKKPRDQWTAQDRAMIDAQIQKTQQSGAVNLGQKGLDNTLKLRSDFRSEPIYKDFQTIDSAYRQINKSLDQKTAAGDLAASTKLMKLLDPTSVVRESELVMAMKATGKLDQLYNYANKVATGQFLSPKQKEEFRTLAIEFYNSAGEQYNSKQNEYAGIAKRNDLNVEDVVGKPVTLKETKTVENKGMPSQTEIQQEINRRLGLKQQGGK